MYHQYSYILDHETSFSSFQPHEICNANTHALLVGLLQTVLIDGVMYSSK